MCVLSPPQVNISDTYLTCAIPAAKGEARGGKVVARAVYPPKLSKSEVEQHGFKVYLGRHSKKPKSQIPTLLQGAGRALGALVVTAKEGQPAWDITCTEVHRCLASTTTHAHT